MSLRVLMVNTHQAGGGAGRVGQLLADTLHAGGDEVCAFVRKPRDSNGDQRQAGTWRETALAAWLGRRGLGALGHSSSFFWKTRAEYASADILHLHNLHGDYVSIAALPVWGFDKPIVWTLHDFWPLTGNCAAPGSCARWRQSCGRCPEVGAYPLGVVDRTRFFRRLKPRLFAAAHPRIVTPSRWLLERVTELPELRRLPKRVIRSPIDCEVFGPLADGRAARRRLGLTDRFTIVLSGNNWADRLKGTDHAMSALRAAGAAIRGLQVLAVGRRSDRLLAATGLPGRALPFIERRDRLAEAYACADVCLFPSQAENYPLTVLESMACGTPVVAYDVGGVPEQIEHMWTGYLTRERHPEALARGLVVLARDQRGTHEMGLRGREFVQRTCAPAVVVEQYRDEYRRAIAAWCRRRRRSSPRYAIGRWAHALADAAWPEK